MFITSQFINFDDLVKGAIYPASLIKLYQPFYDGNNRTGMILFGFLLQLKGYTFDFSNALSDLTNYEINLPVLYSSEDEIDDVSCFYKYISNYDKAR